MVKKTTYPKRGGRGPAKKKVRKPTIGIAQTWEVKEKGGTT